MAPTIPKLPGYSVQGPITGGKMLQQTLSYVGGSAMVDAPPRRDPNLTAVMDQGNGSTLPGWVVNDRHVLRYYGYFKEDVSERDEENHRIRKCLIYFYMDDDSIHIAEPKQENSGIPQGVFVKRHRIATPDGNRFFNFHDLSVGSTVTFYGRTFYVVGCDAFTRNYLTKKGIEVQPDSPFPDDPIDLYRDSLKKVKSGGPPKPRDDDLTRFMEAKLGRASNVLLPDKLKQFLENDGKVLRFFCIQDESHTLYGQRRPYILHFFLADDTIEILEVNEPNDGRDPFPVFLKRQKLPKGKVTINVGPIGEKVTEFLKTEDLGIGKTLSIFDRNFFLHDCDAFTRQELGITEPALDVEIVPEPLPRMNMPPYNGFGSHADSMQNCISLIAKATKKDFHKLMTNEKKVLRFAAQMVESEGRQLTFADRDRKFIFSYFLADDTVSVFEPPARNSGIIGGKFLERMVIYKKNTVKQYMSTDLFVGAQVEIHNRVFELMEADEYSLNYMENLPSEFPYSSWTTVMEAIKQAITVSDQDMRTAFIQFDADGSGYLTEDELEGALKAAGCTVTKQQVITLTRKFDVDGNGKVSIEEFFSGFGMQFEA